MVVFLVRLATVGATTEMAGLGVSQEPLDGEGVNYQNGVLHYCTHCEDEANGRFPVQTDEVGSYPGPQALPGVDIFGQGGDCTSTYQYKSSAKLQMSC